MIQDAGPPVASVESGTVFSQKEFKEIIIVRICTDKPLIHLPSYTRCGICIDRNLTFATDTPGHRTQHHINTISQNFWLTASVHVSLKHLFFCLHKRNNKMIEKVEIVTLININPNRKISEVAVPLLSHSRVIMGVCLQVFIHLDGEKDREGERVSPAPRNRHFQSQMVEADGLAFALLFG